jgi:hypothetical protein
MADAGLDLWSPTAVGVLKQHLSKRLCEIWHGALAAHLPRCSSGRQEDKAASGGEVAEGEAAGPAEGSEDGTTDQPQYSPEQQRDLLIQWLFDVSYLRSCFGPPVGASTDELKDLEEGVYKRTGLEGSDAWQRLIKSSQEYWKRTSLLFGLLA